MSDCPHLNAKHTVFGEVVNGMNVLYKINKIPVKGNEKPSETIIINETVVINNPYRTQINYFREELIQKLKKKN